MVKRFYCFWQTHPDKGREGWIEVQAGDALNAEEQCERLFALYGLRGWDAPCILLTVSQAGMAELTMRGGEKPSYKRLERITSNDIA